MDKNLTQIEINTEEEYKIIYTLPFQYINFKNYNRKMLCLVKRAHNLLPFV